MGKVASCAFEINNVNQSNKCKLHLVRSQHVCPSPVLSTSEQH